MLNPQTKVRKLLLVVVLERKSGQTDKQSNKEMSGGYFIGTSLRMSNITWEW